MKTTHQNHSPVGPTCGRPCHPSAIISATCAQRDPAGFTEPVADFVRGMFAKSLSRLLNCLVVVIWLGILLPAKATTVSITSHTPTGIAPGWSSVTLQVAVGDICIDPDTDITPVLNISVIGASTDGLLQGYFCQDDSRSFTFWIYGYTGDVTVSVAIDGETDDVLLLYAELTSVEARMHMLDADPIITEANFDQTVYFKAITSVDPLPGDLTYEDITWNDASGITGAPWAIRTTDNTTGRPRINCMLGSGDYQYDVWMVKITIKEVTFKGTDFAEVRMDPTSAILPPTYEAPHWDSGGAKPVQYKVGTQIQAEATFTVEPVDYPNNIKAKATGTYSLDEMTDAPAAGLLTITDFSMPASQFLPDQSGLDTPTFNWEFAVGESSFSGAGASDHMIYRTLAQPTVRFRTVVHIACTQTDSDDLNTAFSDIWGYFAGKSVARWDGGAALTYWENTWNYGVDSWMLIALGTGNCDAWVGLFQEIQAVHGYQVFRTTFEPKDLHRFTAGGPIKYKNPGGEMYTQCTPGQGGLIHSGPFYYHAAAFDAATGKVYDAALGESHLIKADWQNATWLTTEYVEKDTMGNPELGTGEWLVGVPGTSATVVKP